MAELHWWFAVLLLLTLVAGLLRALLGPTPGDTMTAAQLFGTTGIALLLVLAETWREPALRDVALVVALLAVLATTVFARMAWLGPRQPHPPPEEAG